MIVIDFGWTSRTEKVNEQKVTNVAEHRPQAATDELTRGLDCF